MAGQGTLILASDYNGLQSNAALILGAGSSTYGYGQAVASSQVGTSSKITATQWSNLRTDLLRCIHHQTNSDYTGSLLDPLNPPLNRTPPKVTQADYLAYKTVSDYIVANRFTLPAGQATREIFSTAQRTASWNSIVTHTVTVTFPESTQYPGTYNSRYFFNSGGYFEFNASRSGGSGGLKNTTWTTLLQNMGSIIFNYDTTLCTGTSSFVSTIGFYDLTTVDQVIFERNLGPTEAYYPNKYYIYARVNNTSTRNQIIFTITFADDSAQPNPPWGTDELVDGTLTSNVYIYRATGSNVSINLPSVSSSGL